MPHSVVHFEILGRDYESLRQYYQDLFGWNLRQPEPKIQYATLDAEEQGHGIGGGIGVVREDLKPLLTIYIEVDDIHAALAKAEELGGETVLPVTQIPGWVTFAHFKDPEGNVVGLVASEAPSAE